MKMKTKIIMVLSVLCGALAANAATPSMWAYELGANAHSKDQSLHCESAKAIIDKGGDLQLGHWYTYFDYCKKYCDEKGIPLFAIYSNHGCVHCWYVDRCFNQQAFKDFQAKKDAGRVIYCFLSNGEAGCPDQSGSNGHQWMRNGGKFSSFPYVAMWWKAGGVDKRYQGDSVRLNPDGSKPSGFDTDKGIDACTENIIKRISSAFKNWHPTPPYSGGYFTQTNYPYASLQAEKTTTKVMVEVKRTATAATNQLYTISAPGKTQQQKTLSWKKDQKSQTITVSSFNTAWYAGEGKNVTLTLYDGLKTSAKPMSTVNILCTTPANSTENPNFEGCSEFGVWTMDLDAAKAKVKGTSGNAWTLACVQGSLWCPDCGRVEKNFLGVKDASGNNKFAAWAKKNNVALVTIDIPNYSSASATAASPCLLTADAYATDPEDSGKKTMHSGLGYLTRKVADGDAKTKKLSTYLTRNHDLASKMTSAGGFNRPEERDYKGRTYRCGAPVFVLLDKNGKVRAELVRLAEDSPTDTSNYANYEKRFDEMIDIAKNNATEIENNYASSGSIEFTHGGTEEARLCNADMYDTFKVGGNAKQKVVVKGKGTFDSDCAVTVEFQKLENGKAVTLGTAKSGTLGAGVTQEYTFTSGGTYYVQVRGWGPETDLKTRTKGYDSAAFSMKSSKASHFQNYTVTLTTTLVPQQDKATYAYAAATKTVSMELVKGAVYRITGLGSGSCTKLAPVAGKDGFYTATDGGTGVINLPAQDGMLVYQIWKSGELAFTEAGRTVSKSVCDLNGKPLQVKVRRTGGKSGAVKATVTVDPKGTTIADKSRYWLTKSNSSDPKAAVEKVELSWADGDQAEKTVYLYIDDAVGWDGNGVVALKAVSNGGEVGDVKMTAGRDVFRLTVTPDGKASPGKAYFSRVEPDYTSKGKVLAREDKGATLYATRIAGTDGLVAAVLQSSVAGTVFQTEDARDLESLADIAKRETAAAELLKKYPKYSDAQVLYWSAGEAGEKAVKVTNIPAGKTAKITLTPVANLKTVSASNKVSIVSIAKNAPSFETEEKTLGGLCRYMVVAEGIKVLNTTKGGKVQFKKLSGSIPSGLKVAYDEKAKAMSLAGIPTKAGKFEAVYQVSETRNGKKVEGLTVALGFKVIDVTKEGGEKGKPLNTAIAKSRTFKNLAVFDDDETTVVGLLQVTVPPTGKVSAKFTGMDGTVSFSAKSWSGFTGAEGALQAELTDKKYGYTMTLEAGANGAILATLLDGEDTLGLAASDGKVWSKTNPAKAWKGYYTVALRNEEIIKEGTKGLAPRGDGYLTLKMDSDSACNSGTFKVAGKLPNGTAVSCSMVMFKDGKTGVLPIFKTSSKDAFSAAVEIAPNAQRDGNRRCVDSKDYEGYWRHKEKSAKDSFEVGFGLYGSYYDKNEDLGQCCEEFFVQPNLKFYVDGDGVIPSIRAVGKDIADIKVGTDALTVSNARDSKLTCKLARATGIVTGKFTHPGLKKSVSYVGIVVNGWGDSCGCGDADVYLPFVSGSYQYTADGVKRGETIGINK